MKKLIIAFCAVIFLAGCKAKEERVANVTQQTTPGGIAYSLVFLPDKDDVSVQIAWPANWAFRENLNQAVPYIGSRLILAGGAEGYSPGSVVETFADLKSEAYLYPTADFTMGELYTKKENLENTLNIANAHLRAPLLDASWLTRVGDGFAANIKEAEANASYPAYEAARWAILGNSPLRTSLSLDDKSIIRAVTVEDIRNWMQQSITRLDASIVIAGNLTPKEAGDAIESLMKGLPDKAPVIPTMFKADFSPKTILVHLPDSKTTSLIFYAPLPPTKDGGEFEDIILSQALGGDDQSVLFKSVRTELRASYSFGAGLDAYTRKNRVLVMNGEVEPGKLTAARDVVLAAYTKFKSDGPAGDLEARKTAIRGSVIEGRDDVRRTAYSTLMGVLDGLDPAISLRLEEELDRVSADTIKARLTDKFPATKDFILVAISPDAAALPGACVIKSPAEAVNCK